MQLIPPPTTRSVIFLIVCIILIAGIFNELSELRTFSEADERMDVYRQYVAACAKKNGNKHFGPMLGFVSSEGGCGAGSRYNGVVCTANFDFQLELKILWDEARARNACVIYKDADVTYKGSTRTNQGISAYGDDGRDIPILLGLREKKK